MSDVNTRSIDVLQAMRVPGQAHVYVLGCLERRVTIYSQQVRALNLIDALLQSGELSPGKKLAIVGAGAAGLTAAAGALRRGLKVTVLEEKDQPLSLYAGGASRWLHPYVYDWPLPGWHHARAGLPVLDWQEGLLSSVALELQQGWNTVKTAARPEDLSEAYQVRDVNVTTADGRVDLTWNADGPGHGRFDVVILAVGFGRERETFPGERSYWSHDDIDETTWFRAGSEKPRKWLVSGVGDGGLIDLLRLRLQGFKHESLLRELTTDPGMKAIKARIREIEAEPWARDLADPMRLQEAYQTIQAPFVVDAMKKRLRKDAVVTLNGTGPCFLTPESCALHRFLVGQLAKVKGGFDYVRGRIDVAQSKRDLDGVTVDIDGSPRRYDRVILRHGPTPALERFPAAWKALEPVRAAWRLQPQVMDRTRGRAWKEGAFGPETRPDLDAEEDPPSPVRFRLRLAGAIDLDPHRAVASDTIVRLGGVAEVAPGYDLGAADGLVLLVGHRLGVVPEGHTKSCEELLVEQALAKGRALLPFVVDPSAAWVGVKEQDLLGEEGVDPETVLRRVQALRAFKQALKPHGDTPFATPESLGAALAARLERWLQVRAAPAAERRVWTIHVEHPLQPAPHFQGRGRLLQELRAWWDDASHPDRVVSLVAIGGTGKTALAEQVFQHVQRHPQGGGVLVWSFYEAPDASAFLRVAEEHFAGVAGEGAGGRLERLKAALRSGEPHLLVLDGLERIQSEGTDGRARGQLEDASIRQLLQGVAAGLGRTRALVTSRFPLVDVGAWKGAGARAHDLDDLDAVAARALLRAWGVRGDDAALDRLAEGVGRHALSVTVLGSFLVHFRGGDPARAPDLDLAEASRDDPLAAKLRRLLTHYATALSDAERDVMARLSVFPRGVGVELLGTLVDAGGEVAGVLVGWDQARFVTVLERLHRLGLVFAYQDRNERVYTAHPFLRDHFAGLLGVRRERIHAAIAERLAAGLDQRPEARARDPETLDRHERLIEHLIGAGRVAKALSIYRARVGKFDHLENLGELNRGRRLMASFVPKQASLDARDQSFVSCESALFSDLLGDLQAAERGLRAALAIDRHAADDKNAAIDLLNLSDLAVVTGRLAEALRLAQDAAAHAAMPSWEGNAARARWLVGDVEEGRRLFATRPAVEGLPLLWEAELRFRLGDVHALRRAAELREAYERNGWSRWVAQAHVLVGLASLPSDLPRARAALAAARGWVEKSGELETQLRAHELAAAVALATRDVATAQHEAQDGITLADAQGYGLASIDLRLALARAHLAAPDPHAALRAAREALDRSTAPECGYAWGEADAAHLCGVAHQRLGEVAQARGRFSQALAVRERIHHPGVADTRAALAALPPA